MDERSHILKPLRQLFTSIVNNAMRILGYRIISIRTYDEIVDAIEWKQTQSLHLPFFLYAIKHADDVEKAYTALADEESRASLDRYLLFRFAYALLGREAAENFFLLGLDNTRLALKYQKRIQSDSSLPRLTGLDRRSIDIVLAQTFCAEQYSLPGICEVAPGDIVIDAGCLIGETAIYFSRKCRETGRVYAFEPVAPLANAARNNIAANVEGDIAEVICAGLGAKNEEVNFTFIPLGSYATEDGSEKAQLVSLDSWIKERRISVNFIKMDIEGAELAALEGAADTIQRYRPKLALSLYHNPDDIVTMLNYIKSLSSTYNFYIRDHSELVLFCVPTS
jgi:FkbM family methyltransferase